MTAINRNFKLTQKNSLPIGFATIQELTAETGLDKFVTSEVLLPFLSEKLTAFYNLILGETPNQALNTLREIGDKLAEMGATDGSIEAMISTIIGTKADISYVDGQLNLKADLAFLNNVIAQIALNATAERTVRVGEEARIEAIANSKVSESYFNNFSQDLINHYASTSALGYESDARITEDARIEAIANSKVSQSAYDAKVAQLDGTIATKVTTAEAEAISQAKVSALRTEMLAIEGIDDAEFARLGALLAQITALESSDVTGIMNLLSQKVNKSDVLDGNAIGTLSEFTDIGDASITDKVVNALKLRQYFQETKALNNTKVAKSDVLGEGNIGDLNDFIDVGDDSVAGKVVNAFKLREYLYQVRSLANSKLPSDNVVTTGWNIGNRASNVTDYANLPNSVMSEHYIPSEKMFQGYVHEIVELLNKKANSADVYTNTESDSALELKASNAHVLQLEQLVATMGSEIAQLRADFDSLTDPA
jgi:hypothetical protein